ncbi:MAG: 1-acyl-sn-glycerol-3-phosphate acyltransferase [Chloroflexi bacterium]|nr:1-acyl-sn-glycerol-3-phosphate acyltransferase [Chloroflexota bacterium]
MDTTTQHKPQTEKYKVPFGVRLRRLIGRPVFRFIFWLLADLRVTGLENVPVDTGYILAYNHLSLVEPPLILAYWPEHPEAIAGDDVFYRPMQGALVRYYGALPVHRGRYDRTVIDTMVQILESERPVMIAPEGGRSSTGALIRALPGVGYLMDQAHVPVVPVAVIGGDKNFLRRAFTFQRPKIEVRIGEPFALPPIEGRGAERRAARQRNADIVMVHLAHLLPEEMQGEYAGIPLENLEASLDGFM